MRYDHYRGQRVKELQCVQLFKKFPEFYKNQSSHCHQYNDMLLVHFLHQTIHSISSYISFPAIHFNIFRYKISLSSLPKFSRHMSPYIFFLSGFFFIKTVYVFMLTMRATYLSTLRSLFFGLFCQYSELLISS